MTRMGEALLFSALKLFGIIKKNSYIRKQKRNKAM